MAKKKYNATERAKHREAIIARIDKQKEEARKNSPAYIAEQNKAKRKTERKENFDKLKSSIINSLEGLKKGLTDELKRTKESISVNSIYSTAKAQHNKEEKAKRSTTKAKEKQEKADGLLAMAESFAPAKKPVEQTVQATEKKQTKTETKKQAPQKTPVQDTKKTENDKPFKYSREFKTKIAPSLGKFGIKTQKDVTRVITEMERTINEDRSKYRKPEQTYADLRDISARKVAAQIEEEKKVAKKEQEEKVAARNKKIQDFKDNVDTKIYNIKEIGKFFKLVANSVSLDVADAVKGKATQIKDDIKNKATQVKNNISNTYTRAKENVNLKINAYKYIYKDNKSVVTKEGPDSALVVTGKDNKETTYIRKVVDDKNVWMRVSGKKLFNIDENESKLLNQVYKIKKAIDSNKLIGIVKNVDEKVRAKIETYKNAKALVENNKIKINTDVNQMIIKSKNKTSESHTYRKVEDKNGKMVWKDNDGKGKLVPESFGAQLDEAFKIQQNKNRVEKIKNTISTVEEKVTAALEAYQFINKNKGQIKSGINERGKAFLEINGNVYTRDAKGQWKDKGGKVEKDLAPLYDKVYDIQSKVDKVKGKVEDGKQKIQDFKHAVEAKVSEVKSIGKFFSFVAQNVSTYFADQLKDKATKVKNNISNTYTRAKENVELKVNAYKYIYKDNKSVFTKEGSDPTLVVTDKNNKQATYIRKPIDDKNVWMRVSGKKLFNIDENESKLLNQVYKIKKAIDSNKLIGIVKNVDEKVRTKIETYKNAKALVDNNEIKINTDVNQMIIKSKNKTSESHTYRKVEDKNGKMVWKDNDGKGKLVPESFGAQLDEAFKIQQNKDRVEKIKNTISSIEDKVSTTIQAYQFINKNKGQIKTGINERGKAFLEINGSVYTRDANGQWKDKGGVVKKDVAPLYDKVYGIQSKVENVKDNVDKFTGKVKNLEQKVYLFANACSYIRENNVLIDETSDMLYVKGGKIYARKVDEKGVVVWLQDGKPVEEDTALLDKVLGISRKRQKIKDKVNKLVNDFVNKIDNQSKKVYRLQEAVRFIRNNKVIFDNKTDTFLIPDKDGFYQIYTKELNEENNYQWFKYNNEEAFGGIPAKEDGALLDQIMSIGKIKTKAREAFDKLFGIKEKQMTGIAAMNTANLARNVDINQENFIPNEKVTNFRILEEDKLIDATEKGLSTEIRQPNEMIVSSSAIIDRTTENNAFNPQRPNDYEIIDISTLSKSEQTKVKLKFGLDTKYVVKAKNTLMENMVNGTEKVIALSGEYIAGLDKDGKETQLSRLRRSIIDKYYNAKDKISGIVKPSKIKDLFKNLGKNAGQKSSVMERFKDLREKLEKLFKKDKEADKEKTESLVTLNPVDPNAEKQQPEKTEVLITPVPKGKEQEGDGAGNPNDATPKDKEELGEGEKETQGLGADINNPNNEAPKGQEQPVETGSLDILNDDQDKEKPLKTGGSGDPPHNDKDDNNGKGKGKGKGKGNDDDKDGDKDKEEKKVAATPSGGFFSKDTLTGFGLILSTAGIIMMVLSMFFLPILASIGLGVFALGAATWCVGNVKINNNFSAFDKSQSKAEKEARSKGKAATKIFDKYNNIMKIKKDPSRRSKRDIKKLNKLENELAKMISKSDAKTLKIVLKDFKNDKDLIKFVEHNKVALKTKCNIDSDFEKVLTNLKKDEIDEILDSVSEEDVETAFREGYNQTDISKDRKNHNKHETPYDGESYNVDLDEQLTKLSDMGFDDSQYANATPNKKVKENPDGDMSK